MKRIDVSLPADNDSNRWLKKFASVKDAQNTIETCSELWLNDTKIISFGKIPDDITAELSVILTSVKYSRAERASGMYSRYRTFGYLPRFVKNRDFCTACGWYTPEEKDLHCRLLVEVKKLYDVARLDFAAEFSRISDEVNKAVIPVWRLPGMPFTSGIINKNTVLPYHKDNANFPNQLSLLACLKKRSQGGNLVIPELGIKLALENGTYVIMDGKRFVHGVSPIFNKAGGYRYTLVLYAMQTMRNCLPIKEELARVRRIKRDRERRRITNTPKQ